MFSLGLRMRCEAQLCTEITGLQCHARSCTCMSPVAGIFFSGKGITNKHRACSELPSSVTRCGYRPRLCVGLDEVPLHA